MLDIREIVVARREQSLMIFLDGWVAVL